MKIKVDVHKVEQKEEGQSLQALANVVFDDCFKVSGIRILRRKDGTGVFVQMPSVKTNKVDENDNPIYNDIANPITKEFREELYNKILDEYNK